MLSGFKNNSKGFRMVLSGTRKHHFLLKKTQANTSICDIIFFFFTSGSTGICKVQRKLKKKNPKHLTGGRAARQEKPKMTHLRSLRATSTSQAPLWLAAAPRHGPCCWLHPPCKVSLARHCPGSEWPCSAGPPPAATFQRPR